jgi:hypothetical protein
MKTNVHILAFLMLLMTGGYLFGQKNYCSPTFLSGCSSWHNNTISLDSIQWALGSTTCTLSDYTNLKTTLIKGNTYSMTVTNGSWCGVGVWIDFDNDMVFADQEVQYYAYIAQASQTYNFNISVPSTVPNGTYRMRVIAGWGTDCYSSTSSNGYGPCGSYQYGNFDDFTVKIVSTQTGVDEFENQKITLGPNPVENNAIVKVPANRLPLKYSIVDITGKLVKDGIFSAENNSVDLSSLLKGVYFIDFNSNSAEQLKFFKQ